MKSILSLFSFTGRASRLHFWMITLPTLLVLQLPERSIDQFYAKIQNEWLGTTLIGIIPLWLNLAVHVRRWHDRDKSAWWLLIYCVPCIGDLWALIELGFLPGTPRKNRYGKPLSKKRR